MTWRSSRTRRVQVMAPAAAAPSCRCVFGARRSVALAPLAARRECRSQRAAHTEHHGQSDRARALAERKLSRPNQPPRPRRRSRSLRRRRPAVADSRIRRGATSVSLQLFIESAFAFVGRRRDGCRR
jgi:hypothetical protein